METCTEKIRKLSEVKNTIDELTAFLETHLPFANVHSVDFMITNLWDKFIPPNIQRELLDLDENGLAEIPSIALNISQESTINETERNVSSYCYDVNEESCTVNSASDNIHFKNRLTHQDIKSGNSLEEYKKDFSDNDPCSQIAVKCSPDRLDVTVPGTLAHPLSFDQIHQPQNVEHGLGNEQNDSSQSNYKIKQTDSCESSSCANLDSFMKDCINHSFEGGLKKLLTSKQELLETEFSLKAEDQLYLSDLMSEKKSHEVDVLANMCALLAKKHSCKLVVDMGSGKGYLGTHLSSRYSLQTLSIDSKEDNTKSAINRAGILKKKKKRGKRGSWSTNENDVLSISNSTESSQLEHLDRNESTDSLASNLADTSDRIPCMSDFAETADKIKSDLADNIVSDLADTADRRTCRSDLANTALRCRYDSGENERLKMSDSAKSENCGGCLSMGTVASGDLNTEQPITTDPTNRLSSHFIPATHFITPETNFFELLRQLVPNESNKGVDTHSSVLLTGLHTCGDLASSILKIFSSSPDVNVICTVGCCYNLLSEECFDGPQSTDKPDGLCESEFGFPMSSHLKQRLLRLGKGARNLAAQSLHRLSANKSLQGKTFFDRALLEKIVVDLTGSRPDGQISLRNLKKRSRSHYDYIHKAFIKLGLSTEKLTPELVDEYLFKYQQEEFKIAAFFQLRALLSHCIETLIMLDRACYLLEQDNSCSVDIVKLFDPCTSPRCFALIATKY